MVAGVLEPGLATAARAGHHRYGAAGLGLLFGLGFLVLAGAGILNELTATADLAVAAGPASVLRRAVELAQPVNERQPLG